MSEQNVFRLREIILKKNYVWKNISDRVKVAFILESNTGQIQHNKIVCKL